MKKLMIAAAIVCAAVISQGATAYWNATQSNKNYIYTDTAGTVTYSGQAYLFVITSSFDQDKLLKGIRDGGKITDYTAATGITVASGGTFAATPFSNTATSVDQEGKPDGTQSFFLAIVNGDDLFLSKTITAGESGDPEAATGLGFPTSAASKKFNSDTDLFGGTGGKGAGWYAASVPEPTSGLLLLLGMAGLALKRKRA